MVSHGHVSIQHKHNNGFYSCCLDAASKKRINPMEPLSFVYATHLQLHSQSVFLVEKSIISARHRPNSSRMRRSVFL